MKSAGLSGTTYLIRSAVDQKNYMSRKQICDLGNWDWALALHHETPLSQLQNRAAIFKRDQSWLQGLCTKGVEKTHFAYPLGIHNFNLENEMRSFFASARTASGGLETLPPANPLALRTLNVTPKVSAEEILKRSEAALKGGDWLILMFHRLRDKPEDDLDYPTAEFRKLIQGLKPHKGSVRTVPEVLSKP